MPGSWVLKYDGECRPVHKCDGYPLAAARCWPFIVYTRPLAIPPPFLPCPIPHHPYHLCVGGWIRTSPRRRSALLCVCRGWERSRDPSELERLSTPPIRVLKCPASEFPSGAYVCVCSPWGSLTFTIKREARASSVDNEATPETPSVAARARASRS